VTEAALTFGSKLSLTSHLSILAEDALLVAVCVNSLACGCRHLKASCKPKAFWWARAEATSAYKKVGALDDKVHPHHRWRLLL